nr:MAG TPA: RimK-related lysine biosynthesis protein, Probable-dependent amine/thiol ligase family Amino-group [Caudoviricetes sp.]
MMADYISREAALKDFESCNAENPNWTPTRVKTLLIRQPAADVAPVVHGKWVHSRYDRSSGQFDVVKCSRCGLEAYAMAYHVRDGNYCPRCGAKMDGGNENDS